jgi:hypothetical protein
MPNRRPDPTLDCRASCLRASSRGLARLGRGGRCARALTARPRCSGCRTDRRHAARDHPGRFGGRGVDDRPPGDLLVFEHGARVYVHLRPRRPRLVHLLLADAGIQHAGRIACVQRVCDRPRRQRRPDAGGSHRRRFLADPDPDAGPGRPDHTNRGHGGVLFDATGRSHRTSGSSPRRPSAHARLRPGLRRPRSVVRDLSRLVPSNSLVGVG